MPVPNDLRQMNRRQVLLASLKSGPTTRSGIARLTGISQPTTGKIIESLIDDGVLREAADAALRPVRVGRPGYYVKVDDVRPRFLGVQLGVHQTRIAPLAVAPSARDEWAVTIPTERGVDAWAAAVAAAAKPLTKRKPAAVLVSVPGVLDPGTGISLLSPNAHWTEGRNVADALGRSMGVPAEVIQEIQCLAVGYCAVQPEHDDFLLVDFGTGVGSAAILRGGLMRGPKPWAGELGHTPVPGATEPCTCGGVGCLETIVGRGRLFRTDAPGDADTLSPAEADQLKDPATHARVNSGLEAAGFAIAGAMNVLGLDHVVITGFVADLPLALFDVLRQSVSRSAVAARFGDVRTEAAPRHRLAGLASVGIDRFIAPA